MSAEVRNAATRKAVGAFAGCQKQPPADAAVRRADLDPDGRDGWGGRTWCRNSETLIFAVGDAGGPEARFAARLAAVLKSNNSRLRLKIVANADNAKALAQFDRQAGRPRGAAHRRQGPAARPGARDPRARRGAADQPRQQEDQIARRAEEKEDRGARPTATTARPSSATCSKSPTAPTPPRGSSWRRRIRRSTNCSRPAATAR